jgi:hypothetical protein
LKKKVWIIVGAVAVCLISGFFYTLHHVSLACNVARHDEAWLRTRLDESLLAGYEYLYKSSAFRMSKAEGGEHAVHHFLLEQALKLEPHSGLTVQMNEANGRNKKDRNWTVWFPLTGHGIVEELGENRVWFQAGVQAEPDFYGSWFMFAAYPTEIELPEDLFERLFEKVELLDGSYDLTHAHMTYQFFQRSESNTGPSKDVIAKAKEGVNRRLEEIQKRALTVGDAYIERIALWALDGHPIKQRWMERMLESQGADGGWVVAPSYVRRFQELSGLEQREETSGVHSTFLAVLAISHYRAMLDGSLASSGGAE